MYIYICIYIICSDVVEMFFDWGVKIEYVGKPLDTVGTNS